ncbi:protein kinase domain-containing protein [Sorangium sp. So ce887]|uniref:protein kinase domain-containing protein n=1 Tax=Sorangium sp. So ce887 TaxID=3133324 RepID=UPI003F5F587A
MVEPGTVWEGHRILSEVHDGMVRTFLAQQVGNEDAIVWLHLREGQPMDRTAFASELQRLQDLARAVPQVEPVLYGDAGGLSAWVACRRSHGISIKDATRGADLGVTALHMVIEVARVIQRCHALGWCHGALGPDRVFITSKRDYSISQFGLVRLFRIEPHEAAREPLVAPPELLSGDRVGPRADVYGLGTLLYELVCRRSLDAGQPGTLGAQRDRPAISADTPPAVAAAIEMALEEDPRRRYRNVGHFITVLEGLVDAWPTLDRAPSSGEEQASVAGAVPSTLRSSHLESPRSPAPATEDPDIRSSDVAPVAVPSSEDEPPLPQIPSLDVPLRTAPTPKEPVLPPPPSVVREPGREPMMARSNPSGTPPRKRASRVAVSLVATAALCAGALCLTRPTAIAPRAEKLGTVLVELGSPLREPQRLPSPVGSARTASKEADSRPRAARSQRTGVTAKAVPRRPYCEAGDFSCGPALY